MQKIRTYGWLFLAILLLGSCADEPMFVDGAPRILPVYHVGLSDDNPAGQIIKTNTRTRVLSVMLFLDTDNGTDPVLLKDEIFSPQFQFEVHGFIHHEHITNFEVEVHHPNFTITYPLHLIENGVMRLWYTDYGIELSPDTMLPVDVYVTVSEPGTTIGVRFMSIHPEGLWRDSNFKLTGLDIYGNTMQVVEPQIR